MVMVDNNDDHHHSHRKLFADYRQIMRVLFCPVIPALIIYHISLRLFPHMCWSQTPATQRNSPFVICLAHSYQSNVASVTPPSLLMAMVKQRQSCSKGILSLSPVPFPTSKRRAGSQLPKPQRICTFSY